MKIGIVTYETDLHGHAIMNEIRRRSGASVELFAVDSVILNGGLSWSSDVSPRASLRSLSGNWFRPAELDLIWWRRINQPLTFPTWLTDPIERDFITHEWRSALIGMLNDGFHGVWINSPANDLRAGNKLYQLNIAKQIGLRVPRTLVSQEPADVRAFCQELGGRVVAKKIVGTQLKHTVSVVVTIKDLCDDDSIRLCPAIYQEIIPSKRHLRVNCFGRGIYSTLIESDVFDWRRDLNVPFSSYRLDSQTEELLVEVVEMSGLRMGIMDMVLQENDEPVWLELNPQGQFLFCEALSGYNLTERFVDFLFDQAGAASMHTLGGQTGEDSHSSLGIGVSK